MRQIEYIGQGSFDKISSVLGNIAVKNIFLVTGKRSYGLSGAEQLVNKTLSNYFIKRFSDFKTNPNLEDVLKGISAYNSEKFDVVIAIGGGSVIDMGKLINIFSHNQQIQPEAIIKKEKSIEVKGVPLIAVPTTAGSGSEATHFAVVYIEKTKYSVAHDFLQPDVAIIDPQFLESLNPRIRASSGMDALCQAIESYWNINSTAESRKFASQAIRLVKDNILQFQKSKETNDKLALAAHLAGKAINI
ncbi:MAG: phosphonoacetaldehyde reductase, partial [Candidatus Hodarchaeales archaeon]